MQGKINYPKPNESVFTAGLPNYFQRSWCRNNEREQNSKVKKGLSTTDKFFHEIEYYSQKFVSL